MRTSKRHKKRLKRQIDISKTGEKNLEKKMVRLEEINQRNQDFKN